MKPVIFEADAQDEVANALAHSPVPGEFRIAIDEAVAAVGANPQMGVRLGRSAVRRFVLPRFPYSLIYQEEGDGVHVYAFPHHRQRPGYWKKRLRGS